ncbi:hypothetical protein [Exiguobacterium flavidum]|uniref:hypothetical protein n=1 Tax=Exiguobacterium flavidum TaxID=2184695 RepID=UPI000DF7F9EA|nr:hypothetical protein [Exiguobacterium flavidum]
MGMIKGFSSIAGKVVGGVTGGLIKGVGELTGSDFIKEVGDGVKSSTEFAGKQLGNFAEGAWNVGSGLVAKDDEKVAQGMSDIGEGASQTGKAVVSGVKATASSALQVAEGVWTGDEEQWKKGLREVGKTAAVAAFGLSALDLADVADVTGNEGDAFADDQAASSSEASESVTLSENPNTHDVVPHERVLADGTVIWVDGDGDTTVDRSVDQGGGWTQTNPDHEVKHES